MNSTTRYIAALSAVAAIAAAATPAYAADSAPPLKGGVHCQQVLKKAYRLKSVINHGMPIKITCDGPARFFAQPDFMANTQQDRDLTVIGGHTALPVATARETGLAQAGTKTVRPRLTKVAIRVIKRYKKTKTKVGLGTLREDGYFWSDPSDWSHTVVVR
jgi:hypothetical protein